MAWIVCIIKFYFNESCCSHVKSKDISPTMTPFILVGSTVEWWTSNSKKHMEEILRVGRVIKTMVLLFFGAKGFGIDPRSPFFKNRKLSPLVLLPGRATGVLPGFFLDASGISPSKGLRTLC